MAITVRNVIKVVKRRIGLEKDGREWLLKMMPKHSVCAEVGVHEGVFSRVILQIVHPTMLHLIDPWKFQSDPLFASTLYGGNEGQSQEHMDRRYNRVVKKFAGRTNVTIRRSGSLDCLNQFPDNYYDWIYLDGDHRYECVIEELRQFYCKMKPGGFVAGDDYARRKDNWTKDGVTRAVDQILGDGMYENVVIQPESHQFVLRKPVFVTPPPHSLEACIVGPTSPLHQQPLPKSQTYSQLYSFAAIPNAFIFR
jgi:hypothetical protein